MKAIPYTIHETKGGQVLTMLSDVDMTEALPEETQSPAPETREKNTEPAK